MDILTAPLRTLAVTLLTILGLLALVPSASAASTPAEAEQRLLDAINRERAGAGLGALVMESQVTDVARGWAGAMAGGDTLAHNPSYAQQITGERVRAGENVGYTVKTGASLDELVDRLHTSFMNSPGHRANVLGDYNAVGVGATLTPGGKLWMTVNFVLRPYAPAPPAPPAPPAAPAAPAVDGQVEEAVATSREVFGAGDSAGHVVLARGDVFADALSGSGLAGREAPILFTGGASLHPATRAEIDRVLPAGGTVYLLGGEAAIAGAVEVELAGSRVVRLAGASRVETSVRVAEEVVARNGAPAEVLIARSDDWADAISGGAYAGRARVPLLLTERDRLHPAVQSFLARTGGARRHALGGSAALADAVVREAGAGRVAGADRVGTAIAIAEQLWGRTRGTKGDNFVGIQGYRADGWAYALAQTAWTGRNAAPQLLVGDEVSPAVVEYLQRSQYGAGTTANLRTASTVPGPVGDTLRALLAR